MKSILHYSLLALICASAGSLCARNDNPNPAPHLTYKTEANDCNVPSSMTVLDINNVRATLLTAGDMWFNPTTSFAGYAVPKTAPGVAGPNAIFAGSIWVTGFDQGNNLRAAAMTYRSNGTDFYSGPLDNTGNATLATCNLWDQHFPVWASQIRPLVAAYQAALAGGGTPGSITLPSSVISDSVKFWPAKGNPYLAALGYEMGNVLAPFYDADGDGSYDPAHGDYPTIAQGGLNPSALGNCGSTALDSAGYSQNSSYADQMIFWVTNDKGNVHNGTSGGIAIGLQINSLAFAFQSNDAINDMTFYRHQFVNKSGAVLNNACISQYTDVDLGCPNNDAVGCDPSKNMAFAYNGTPGNSVNTPGYNYVCDQGAYCSGGTVGYGCTLPVIGIAMLETPQDTSFFPDPNNPSIRIHRQTGMTSFMSYYNSSAATGDPATAVQFRNYQTSKWRDGTPLTYGGNGYQNTTTQTSFMFPGDPAVASQWSECNPQMGGQIYAGDRRFVQSAGGFTFLPCASQYMTIAVTFTASVNSNCPSLAAFTTPADQAQTLFNSVARLSASAPVATAVNDIKPDRILIYPNPTSSMLTIETSPSAKVQSVSLYDVTGRVVLTQMGDVHTVDMSSLPEGIYIVRALVGTKEEILKVAKR